MSRYICIHGHFYQPPRENAWLESVEIQDSAYPYHDWNERITAECYAPNTSSRILDWERRIIDIVNNYAKISFNIGPTLLAWIAKREPDVHQAIVEADKQSREMFSGHGSALAQVYNHMIMPLANKGDKHTQVYWGVKDFESRFGRKPEGMWLPETAVDLETLEVLAEHGIQFTILSPYQAGRIRKIGEKEWINVDGGKVNPKRPYLCKLPSGKKISLFFYDGPISQDIGFGNLLDSGENFANRLMDAFSEEQNNEPELVHIATDGETYGHHRKYGDMALSYCLYYLESNELAKITNYGEFMENNPPKYEAEILENTSWSCAHGIERWRSDCGCNIGTNPNWHQAWRAPLRDALDWLREEVIDIYQKEASSLIKEPWQARDDYIDVILNRSINHMENYLNRHAATDLSDEQKIKMLELLEMQRHAMLMYTSCGWFFDEISGIETTQILQYAARALQLAEKVSGKKLEQAFMGKLEKAPSNIQKFKNGANIYEKFIKSAQLDLLRVGAHYAVSSLFEEYTDRTQIYCYTANSEFFDKIEAGRIELAVGQATVHSDITWEESEISHVVLYLGGHILNGGVREFMGNDAFNKMHHEIKEVFQKGDISEVLRLMDEHFESHNYSLWHLFKDEQRKIFDQILTSVMEEIEFRNRQTYESSYALIQAMQNIHIPPPRALIEPVEFTLNTDMKKLLESEEIDLEGMQHLIEQFNQLDIKPDEQLLSFVAKKRVNQLMQDLSQNPFNTELIMTIKDILRVLTTLPLSLDIWEAQNIFFFIGREYYDEMQEKANNGKGDAKQWMEQFNILGDFLSVRII